MLLFLALTSPDFKSSCQLVCRVSSEAYKLMLQGDYNQYECGLTVGNARAEDDGEWKCDFESYVKVGEDFLLEYFEEELFSLFCIYNLSSGWIAG